MSQLSTAPPTQEVIDLTIELNKVVAGKTHSLAAEALQECLDGLASISIVTLPPHQSH